jgi:mRNA interferase MazF
MGAGTSSFNFGRVVLMPFPFTDQSGSKKRPAVVVSSYGYSSRSGLLNQWSPMGKVPG